jgi:hypothetical protein
MKGMRKISRGRGFSGVLSYCLEGEKGEIGHGKLIGGSMAGNTKGKLSSEFRAVSALRPDIDKPVWHSSLRMPKGQDVSDDKWRDIAHDYMQSMGWPDSTQYAVFKHSDEHVHIVANRVLVDSTVYLGQNENLKSTRVIGELELRHGLTLTKGPDLDQEGKIIMPDKSQLKKSEIERGLRTGEKPAKLVLQDVLTAAMKSRPTMAVFLERLDAAGVVSMPHVASTGRMNGFTFTYDGVSFKGSQIGKAFGWAGIEREIDYEQTRDSAELTRRRDAEQRRAADDSVAAAAAGAADAGVGTRSSDNTASPSADAPGTDDQSDGRAPDEDRSSHAQAQGRDIGHARSSSDTGADARAADITEIKRVIERIAQPAEQKDLAVKVAAWRQQHAGLGASTYRLTMKDRVLRDGKDRSHNIGKSKDPKNKETFYDAAAVEKMIPTLRAKNARGFDIYITPIDPKFHYIVIDDMKPSIVGQLKADGFEPCLVQSSSADNVQAVLKVPRLDRKDEQRIANQIVVDLNKKYGDPKFSGVIHPFRMAGFSNKKPGKANAFTRVLEALEAVCRKAGGILSSLRQKTDQEAANRATEAAKADRIALISETDRHAGVGLRRAYQQQAHWLTKGKQQIDWSAVDFGVACELLKKGFDADDVGNALRDGSPALVDRHSDAEMYLRKTLRAAELQVGPIARTKRSDLKI